MISLEQYVELLPYRNVILVDKSASGSTAKELQEIYAQHGRITNVHCKVCVGTMLDYFALVILEYEESATGGA